MKVIISNELTNNQELTFNKNLWTEKTIIMIDNQPLERVAKNKFSYLDKEGVKQEVKVMGNVFSGYDIQFNNNKINVLRKLNTLEYILSILPLYLIIFGGAIGGGCAGIGFITIVTLIRELEKPFLKFLISVVITGGFTLIWFLIITLITMF